MRRCPECNRRFDLLDETDAAEWYYGHDCEGHYHTCRRCESSIRCDAALDRSGDCNDWPGDNAGCDCEAEASQLAAWRTQDAHQPVSDLVFEDPEVEEVRR